MFNYCNKEIYGIVKRSWTYMRYLTHGATDTHATRLTTYLLYHNHNISLYHNILTFVWIKSNNWHAMIIKQDFIKAYTWTSTQFSRKINECHLKQMDRIRCKNISFDNVFIPVKSIRCIALVTLYKYMHCLPSTVETWI